MNGISDYVVGIDLGSSKMVGALGKREENGVLNVLTVEEIPTRSVIRHGIVHNIEEVASSIRDMIAILSRFHGKPIGINHVYVGVNGYSTRTKEVAVHSLFTGEELVQENDLYELLDQVRDQVPENFDILDIFTQEFLVDGKLDQNPIGSMPQKVEGFYKVVGGKDTISRNLEATFRSVGLNFRTVLGPVASAEAALHADEKTKGAVCIDFGAETTSLCIYKNNMVRFVSILPFGGQNISNDLLQLNLDESEAEEIKLTKGNALHYTELKKADEEAVWSKEDMEINEIIVARVEEIVENIWAQIIGSGIDTQRLIGGLVITGGASKLSGLTALLARKTQMSVRLASPDQNVLEESVAKYGKPEYTQCIGVLLKGEGGCCSLIEEPKKVVEEPKKVEIPTEQVMFQDEVVEVKKTVKVKTPKPPKPSKPSFGEKLNKLINMFDTED
jgi:cell division protein FtsA